MIESTEVSIGFGDCLVAMDQIDEASVDLIAADLPYGTTSLRWDSVIPLEPLWEHFRRVLKPRGAVVLTASQPFTSMLVMSNQEWFKYCLVWTKTRPSDFINAKNKPMKSHEDILIFSSGTTANHSSNRMIYNPQGLIDVEQNHFRPKKRNSESIIGHRPSHFTHTTGYIRKFTGYPTSVIHIPNPNNDTVHPSQKPVALFEYLVQTYSNEGDTVLDCTMGSGTTGVACVNTCRSFIGIEKDEKYFEIAERRISEAINNVKDKS